MHQFRSLESFCASSMSAVARYCRMFCITTFETNRVKITVPGMGDWFADLEKEFNIFRETLPFV